MFLNLIRWRLSNSESLDLKFQSFSLQFQHLWQSSFNIMYRNFAVFCHEKKWKIFCMALRLTVKTNNAEAQKCVAYVVIKNLTMFRTTKQRLSFLKSLCIAWFRYLSQILSQTFGVEPESGLLSYKSLFPCYSLNLDQELVCEAVCVCTWIISLLCHAWHPSASFSLYSIHIYRYKNWIHD